MRKTYGANCTKNNTRMSKKGKIRKMAFLYFHCDSPKFGRFGSSEYNDS
jgi:hypothetical protein